VDHIREQLERRAVEHHEHTLGLSQPWLHFLIHNVSKCRQHLLDNITETARLDRLTEEASLVVIRKPDGRPRPLCCVPIEVEVAVINQSYELVQCIERARRRISRANMAIFRRDCRYWSLEPFRGGRSEGYQQHHQVLKNIKEAHAPGASFDIKDYFPSLGWGRLVAVIAELLGCDPREVQDACRHLDKVRQYLDKRMPGLPVGPELSATLTCLA
jgi:hypothetical protein